MIHLSICCEPAPAKLYVIVLFNSVATLNAAAQRLMRDDQNADAIEKMNQMNKEWKELNDVLEALIVQMERVRAFSVYPGRSCEGAV